MHNYFIQIIKYIIIYYYADYKIIQRYFFLYSLFNRIINKIIIINKSEFKILHTIKYIDLIFIAEIEFIKIVYNKYSVNYSIISP